MQNTSRPRSRMWYLPALAVAVALVAAVSSWAASPSTTPSQGSAPAAQEQTLPVQDTQTTPAPPQRAPGGREDCPDKGGDGAGGTAAPQAGAPQAAPTSSEV
jgi:hypothetical protein